MKDSRTALMQAAEAFDEQLSQFEAAAESLEKSPMNSGKHLERVAFQLKDVAAIDEKLGEQVRSLVGVINQVRDRQQTQAAAVVAKAQELQRRTAEFQALQEKYSSLGKMAAELNASLQGALESTGGQPVPALNATLEQVNVRLGQAAEQAGELAKESDEKDFSDMARHSESLRQQVLSTKNRLQLLADKLRQQTN